MLRSCHLLLVLTILALMVPMGTMASPSALPDARSPERIRAFQVSSRRPLSFEINRGQASQAARFLARGDGYSLAFTPREVVLSLRKKGSDGLEKLRRRLGPDAERLIAGPSALECRAALRMHLAGTNGQPQVQGQEQQPGRSHYLIGDRSQWRTNVRHFGKVLYNDVYPGIDAVYYGNQRQLEYDFIVAPHADPRQIRLKFQGAQKIGINPHGELVLQVGGEQVVQRKPVLYQDKAGHRESIVGGYKLLAGDEVCFSIGSYDRSRPLVIDPILIYSTYLGGSGFDTCSAIAVDSSGNAYVTGSTPSSDFPTTAGVLDRVVGYYDAFVTKYSPTGILLYSTYLGGSREYEEGKGIAVDDAGNVYVTGSTYSSDFPTTPGALKRGGANSYNSDAFVTKLNASGSALIYSTLVGGNTYDHTAALALDASGNVYITGYTGSADFPTVNAFQSTLPGSASGASYESCFVTKVNASGSALVYSTFLNGGSNSSGSAYEGGRAIAVDSAGQACVVGQTASSSFPTRNAYQSSLRARAAMSSSPSSTRRAMAWCTRPTWAAAEVTLATASRWTAAATLS